MSETGTEQLNVRVASRLAKRLEKIALRFNKRSKSTVATEIIEQYTEFYEQLEQSKRDVFEAQRRKLGLQAGPPGQLNIDSMPAHRHDPDAMIMGDVTIPPDTPQKKPRKNQTGTDDPKR